MMSRASLCTTYTDSFFAPTFAGGRLKNIIMGTTDTQITDMNDINECNSEIGPLGAGEVRTFPCTTTGRYVVIVRQEVNAFLTLCEVEVYGEPVGKHCIADFISQHL